MDLKFSSLTSQIIFFRKHYFRQNSKRLTIISQETRVTIFGTEVIIPLFPNKLQNHAAMFVFSDHLSLRCNPFLYSGSVVPHANSNDDGYDDFVWFLLTSGGNTQQGFHSYPPLSMSLKDYFTKHINSSKQQQCLNFVFHKYDICYYRKRNNQNTESCELFSLFFSVR